VAWVPLIWLEAQVANKKTFFALVYLTMFIWNIGTTWWIWNASPPGAVAAFLANSLLMCLPWLGYKIARRRMGNKWGYVSLIAFWMTFEFIHLQDWGLSWPWLTLGNAFATHPGWVQWYQYTGTSGGTLWILLSNILVYALFKEYQRHGRSRKYFTRMAIWLLLLIAPILILGLNFRDYVGNSVNRNNIVIVQPNIDPYEKVSEEPGSFEKQLQKLVAISEQ
jgi:apolipoprotein N-acyltransferase